MAEIYLRFLNAPYFGTIKPLFYSIINYLLLSDPLFNNLNI